MEILKLLILSCQIVAQSPSTEAVRVVAEVQRQCLARRSECLDKLFTSPHNQNPMLSKEALLGACVYK